MVQGSEGTRCHASNLIDFSYPDICSGQFFSLRNPRPVGCHVSIIYLSKVISVILRRWVRSIFKGSWAYACVVDLLLRLPPILPHSLIKGKYMPTKRSPFFYPFYNMISSKMRCRVFDSDGLMNASNAFCPSPRPFHFPVPRPCVSRGKVSREFRLPPYPHKGVVDGRSNEVRIFIETWTRLYLDFPSGQSLLKSCSEPITRFSCVFQGTGFFPQPVSFFEPREKGSTLLCAEGPLNERGRGTYPCPRALLSGLSPPERYSLRSCRGPWYLPRWDVMFSTRIDSWMHLMRLNRRRDQLNLFFSVRFHFLLPLLISSLMCSLFFLLR